LKPRVLIVGRSRYRLPLETSLRRKFDSLSAQLEVRVVGSGVDGAPVGDDTFALVPPARRLDGPLFWARLPWRLARELRQFRPDAVSAQSPYEGFAALLARRLARTRTPVLMDVHGDWRTSTRLYGSPLRRAASPVADRLSLAALRRADAIRAVSPYTARVVREAGLEPADEFPAFMDLEPFLDRPPAPLPERPVALFVGVLERYKNVDGLADAWRLAAPRVPEAQLRIVGRGSLAGVVRRLVAELPQHTSWDERLEPAEVARALDEATVLVLPSRSEGMGRVLVEALCRGRGVVGARVGGIPDLVVHGENGILVDPADTDGIAAAIVSVLGDHQLAARLAAGARAKAEAVVTTPEQYAAALRSFVERVLRLRLSAG
jgi:glycosyltransferase involved in cell wall biosynthesis